MSRHKPDDNERLKWQNPLDILADIGVGPGTYFVDAGCGNGFFTLPAARIAGPDGCVWGFDISPAKINSLKEEAEKYCYAGYLIKATPNNDILISDYLMYYTDSLVFENWKNSIFNKATIENIGADKYSVLHISIPPKKEQAQIVSHIKTETAKIDQAIAKAQKEIELIKEYKEAMIAEAVLGKFNHKQISNKKIAV